MEIALIKLFVVPAAITFGGLTALVIAATWFAPQWQWKRGWTFLGALLLAGLLSVPVFRVVRTTCYSFFFAEVTYATAAEVNDSQVQRYLPAAATDIRLYKEPHGHHARYRISPAAFDEFIAATWDRYRADRAAAPKYWLAYTEEEIARARAGSSVGRFEPQFRVTEMVGNRMVEKMLSWEPLADAVAYAGPRKSSHAGANYWFDRSAGLAYHDAGYW